MDVAVNTNASSGQPPAHWSTVRTASPRSTRAPNRVKSKPANLNVLSSIIDSLDTLTPLPDLPPNDHFSETASKHSSTRSVASFASIHKPLVTSPGFGVTYGAGLELDDVDGVTDAALPPTIPTSRGPSGLTHQQQMTLKPDGKHSMGPTTLRPSPNSRKSSLGSTTSAGSARNKLSSESWVRRSLSKGEDEPRETRGRTAHKSRLRRVSSQGMLRLEESRPSSEVISEEGDPASLAEHIIPQAPSQVSSVKGRLYLSDATTTTTPANQSAIASPQLTTSNSFDGRSAKSESKASDQRLSVSEIPRKTPSPISDSIPTRTSSLHTGTPARKKKQKKSKKHNPFAKSSGKTEATAYRPSSPIPESSWADLGDDDDTVKRIRELREQRKSRLQEKVVDPVMTGLETNPMPQRDNASDLSIPLAEDATSQTRASLNRQSTPAKAHKTLGLDNEHYKSRRSDVDHGTRSAVGSIDVNPRPKYSLDIKRPSSAHHRPTTAMSVDSRRSQRLNLDYSYVKAMNLFQKHDRDQSPEAERQTQEWSETPLAVKSVGFDSPTTQTPTTELHSGKQKVKKPKRKSEDKWTGNHPDLPLAFEKRRHRRKSMSDARLTNAEEKELALARRDSIEEAVSQYLQAPRLNRKVKNHLNGRTIAYSEVGDPNGAAVFVCVGMGLTRYVTAFYDELATTLRLRLITLDRPGVGGSEPYPPSDKSGPLNWPEDVLTICQHLGIVKFSILAHSAGAIYALATALILPHLVRGKVHLLAPWVPPSQLEAISHPTASAPPSNPLPRSQRILRVLPTPFLKAANSSFMTATSASLKPANKRTMKSNANRSSPRRQVLPDDAVADRPPSRDRPEYNRRESLMLMDQFMPSTNPVDNFPIPVKEEEEDEERRRRGSLTLTATSTPMDPSFAYASIGLHAAEHAEKERQVEYTSRLTQATWDMATRDSNPATDLLVCLERNRDVGFRYTDVGREVVITHGSEDKRVPVANVKWLAEQMNRRAQGPGFESGNGREGSRESWASSAAKGGCEVRILEGEGHGLMASPLIMANVLEEMALAWQHHDKGRL